MHHDLPTTYLPTEDALAPTWWTRMSRRKRSILKRSSANTKIIAFVAAFLLATVIGLGCGAGLALIAWTVQVGQ